MGVYITSISSLDDIAKTHQNYHDEFVEDINKIEQNTLKKVGENEATALDKLVEIINDLQRTVLIDHPTHIQEFVDMIKGYTNNLRQEGFSNAIVSFNTQITEYKNKLTKDQVDLLNTPSNEAMTIIRTVLKKDNGIQQLMDEFATSMATEAASIENTHNALINYQKTFMDSMQIMLNNLKIDNDKINRIKLICNPKTGLQMETLKTLLTLDPNEFSGLLGGAQELEDFVAMECLANEDYENLFHIDPDKLSDSTYLALIERMMNLIEDGEEQPKLQGVLNDLLKSEPSIVEGHMVRLIANADVMAYQIATMLVSDNVNEALSEDDIKEKLEEWKKLQALSTLYQSIYVMDKEIPFKSEINPFTGGTVEDGGNTITRTSITNLVLNGQQFSFDSNKLTAKYNNETGEEGKIITEVKVEKIEARYFMSENGYSESEKAHKINQLKSERDKLIKEMFANSVITAVGITNPVAGIITGALKDFYDDNGLSAGGKLDKAVNPYDKNTQPNEHNAWVAQAALVAEIASVSNKLNGLDAEIEKEKKLLLYDILGLGGQSTVIDNEVVETTPGLKTPGAIRVINTLNKDGIEPFMPPLDESMSLEGALEATGLNKDNETYKFLKGDGDITKVDPQELQEALSDIETYTKCDKGYFSDLFEERAEN